jgi:hypothetical protein
MKDPEFPDDAWVKAARRTVAHIHQTATSRGDIVPHLAQALWAMSRAEERGDWEEASTQAGMVCTLALVLQLDAIARMHAAKGSMQ